MYVVGKKRLTQRAPDPWESIRTVVVGVAAFSGSFLGFKLVPAKSRPLVLPRRVDWRSRVETTSGYPLQGATANASG